MPSVISEMVDKALEENNSNFMHQDDDLRSVFLKILEIKDLDVRDKKSAIIDFIAAGIETVSAIIIPLIFLIYFFFIKIVFKMFFINNYSWPIRFYLF